MAAYEDFLVEVSPYAPNCPEPVMVNAIRNTVIDFCTVTGWLTQDMAPITLTADEPIYDVEPDDEMELIRVMAPIWCEGMPLPAKTELQLRREMALYWPALTAKRPTCFTQLSREQIRVVPVPTESVANALTGRLVVKPKRSSTTIDDKLLEHHAETIAAGALERIMLLPDEAYSSPEKALFHGKRYRAMRAAARIEVNSAFGEAPLRVSPRSW